MLTVGGNWVKLAFTALNYHNFIYKIVSIWNFLSILPNVTTLQLLSSYKNNIYNYFLSNVRISVLSGFPQ